MGRPGTPPNAKPQTLNPKPPLTVSIGFRVSQTLLSWDRASGVDLQVFAMKGRAGRVQRSKNQLAAVNFRFLGIGVPYFTTLFLKEPL